LINRRSVHFNRDGRQRFDPDAKRKTALDMFGCSQVVDYRETSSSNLDDTATASHVLAGGDLAYYADAARNLPIFSGELAKYLPWRLNVVSHFLIDKRQPIMKFNSLLQLLKGPPSVLVSSLDPTQRDPVGAALGILDNTYNHPASASFNQQEMWKSIYLRNQQHPSAQEFRVFVSQVKTHVSQMLKFGHDLRHDDKFVTEITSRLPEYALRKWWRFPHADGTYPTLIRWMDGEVESLTYQESVPKFVPPGAAAPKQNYSDRRQPRPVGGRSEFRSSGWWRSGNE